MGGGGSDDTIVATYREIATHFQLASGPDAGRLKARRAGWRTEPGNHPKDPVRVHVPRAAWDAASPVRTHGFKTPSTPAQPLPKPPLMPVPANDPGPNGAPSMPPPVLLSADVLATLLQRFGDMADLRERLARSEAQAERDCLRAERAEARAESVETALLMARAEGDSLRADLAAWMAGGPLARAWRALLYRRG
jgi:hypothetical protein